MPIQGFEQTLEERLGMKLEPRMLLVLEGILDAIEDIVLNVSI